ncbi:hypothetical protein CDL10_02760 [Avrilella dinanensis]|uniref:Rad50/SbcC-type AAA domain-containing protein n=2 Tax=Avrilella dinanensis TaxID=2008672 RepID=A0A2M9R3W2_9FLAO|nr:hypothetical protein CDL10_02760 [Avrilella dinanensis]
MKIKEVQISNFRAFNDVNCSTFNFVNNKNEISDLISIYAPNGFGKTSFYDAVEWGVTGKIERFDLVGDFDKTRKENKKGGNKNILQHIGSTENGFVNVITEKDTFAEKITNTEYNHKKEPKNKFFRDVVLSQEMIDNFLKEQTAEERYNKFVESYPEITKYNNTYKNLGTLLNYSIQEIKRLEKDIKKNKDSQLEIDFELEFKKFDQINEAIQFLRINQETIDLIEKETFDNTLYDILTSQVKSKLVSLQLELEAKKIRIGNIQIARNGDESNNNNGGVLTYIENKKKLANFDLRIKEIKNIISLIENKEKIQAENNSLKEKLSREQNTHIGFLSIEKKLDTYIFLHKEITKHKKRIADLNENNLKVETESTTFRESINRSQNEMAQQQESLKQYQSIINELPNQKSKLELAKKNVESFRKGVTEVSNSITVKQNKLNELQQVQNQFNYYENYIENDLGLLLELNEFKDQKTEIEEQIKSTNKINIQKNELVKIENKINAQNQFNNELKEYVKRGLDIISQDNSTDCPLCSQKYESFEELSSRIVGNKIFDEQLKESLSNKIGIEDKITKLNEEIHLRKEKLKKHLDELKRPFKTEFTKIEKEIQNLSLQKDEKIKELNSVQSNYNEAILFFNNESDIDVFEKKIKKQIENLKFRINELNKTISASTSKINENNAQLKTNNENTEIIKEAVNELKSAKEYNEVIVFFSQTLNSNEVNKVLFETEKQKLEWVINNLKNNIEEKQKKLNEFESKLSSYTLSKEDYLTKLKELDDLKLLTSNIFENFENFIRTEFGINLKDKNKQQIDADFDALIEQEKNNQDIIENKVKQYKVIEALKEDCLKVSVSKKIEIEIDKLKKSLEELKIASEKLDQEKNSLEIYLEKTIDEFFYTDLINTIYKKIDPHPDYESIEFKCEFGESKPRLQIFTIKKNNKGKEIKSIPALYFSTAQINILSLSIFLARALKAKNIETGESVDCIFIDDPIQSMDSINILSFIDLFRGIMTSLGKQLIVSTHEENFHLLLQKKIPKELFKSKFIEFETFGKLKVSS